MDKLSSQRFREFVDLAPEELAWLRGIETAQFEVRKQGTIRREDDPVREVFLLHEGWVISSMMMPGGGRQIVTVHLPGDLLGTPSIVLNRAAETLTAITHARISRLPLDAFGRIFREVPRAAAALFLTAQQERISLMDRMSSIGRTTATQRVAALLVHLYDRLRLTDPTLGTGFSCPLTQEQLGDALGLTAVHVNRVLRELTQTGLIAREGHRLELCSLPRLRSLAAAARREWVREPSWIRQTP